MDKNMGFYGETVPLIRPQDGKVMSIYGDTAMYFGEDGVRTERQMPNL